MIALSIILGFAVGVSAAFFIVAAYRQGIKDGARKSEGRELAPLVSSKPTKKKGEKTAADEFEEYLKKEREGASKL